MDRSIKIGLASFTLTMAALVGPTFAKVEAAATPVASPVASMQHVPSETDNTAPAGSVIHRWPSPRPAAATIAAMS